MIRKKSLSIYNTSTMAWILCLTAACFYAYDFLLRIQPNVLVDKLMTFFRSDAAGIGTLYAAYYWIYTPLQIPAGLVIDKYNTKTLLVTAALVCTIGAFIFPVCSDFKVALIARMLMGLGSAFAFIGAMKLGAAWLPARQFGVFSGLTTSLGTLGALVSNSLLPYWVSAFHWQKAVLLTGYIGLGIALLLLLLLRNRPPQFQFASPTYKTWQSMLRRLLFITKQKAFWINGLVGCLSFLPITVLAGLWGTSFLEKAFAMQPAQAAIADATIFIGISLGGPVAGWISDHMGRRKLPYYFGSLFSILLSFAILYEHSISLFTLFILLFLLGFFTGTQILVFAIGKEISPSRSTGMSVAATNFLVTLGALIFAPLVGYLMVILWDGQLTPAGAPLYSLQTYRTALLMLPISLILALILLFFIPETYCQMQHKNRKKNY